MRDLLRVVATIAVTAIACLSMVQFPVTDSWFSDSGGTDVVVTTGTASFTITDATWSETEEVYTLSEGEHPLTVKGWTVRFDIRIDPESSLKINGTETGPGELDFPVGTYELVSTGTVVLKPV